jgi:hypothetical protein
VFTASLGHIRRQLWRKSVRINKKAQVIGCINLNTFPIPPTANNIYMNLGGRDRIKSKQYREWEKTANGYVGSTGKLQGEVVASTLRKTLKTPHGRRRRE